MHKDPAGPCINRVQTSHKNLVANLEFEETRKTLQTRPLLPSGRVLLRLLLEGFPLIHSPWLNKVLVLPPDLVWKTVAFYYACGMGEQGSSWLALQGFV